MRWHAPATAAEAAELLAREPGAQVVAGGTDLVVAIRGGRRAWPEALVGIDRLADARGVVAEPGGLALGALATHAEIEASPGVRDRWPALADASALVGSPATRGTGTIGGNLMNASPAMELGSPLLVHGASVELLSASGVRALPVAELLAGPGRTTAAPDELLVRVRVPAPGAGSGSAYVRLEYRRAMEIAVVGAAALVSLGGDGRIVGARLALTAVAPTCLLVPAAGDALAGGEPSAGALRRAAQVAAQAASPIADLRASDGYRRAQVEVIARRALEVAVGRARGELLPVPASALFA